MDRVWGILINRLVRISRRRANAPREWITFHGYNQRDCAPLPSRDRSARTNREEGRGRGKGR